MCPGLANLRLQGSNLAPGKGALFAAHLLLAQFAEAGSLLLLLLHTGLFIVFAAPGFSQDAILLDALVEALQGTFERLVIAYDDFRQVRESPAFSREYGGSASATFLRYQPGRVQAKTAIRHWPLGQGFEGEGDARPAGRRVPEATQLAVEANRARPQPRGDP